MEQHTVKLILFHCQGLGLQVDDSLLRISSLVHYVDLVAQTAYLLDDKGEILCILLKDRNEYESKNNQDRRIVNKKNGFNMIWEDDGNSCFVYNENYSSSKSSTLSLIGRLARLLIPAMLIGLLFGYFIWHDEDSSNTTENLLIIESLEEANRSITSQKDSLENVVIELSTQLEPYKLELEIHKDSVRKDCSIRKEELQSMECDATTVSAVRTWWYNLTLDDKKIAKQVYDFDLALTTYSQVFNAEDMYDMHMMSKRGQDIFSPRQMRLLNRIPKYNMRKSFRHMSFAEIENSVEKRTKHTKNDERDF